MLHPLVEDLQLILEQFERDLIGMTKKDALTMLKEKIDEFFKVIELTETEEKCICNHYGVFHPTEGCPIHDDRKKPKTEEKIIPLVSMNCGTVLSNHKPETEFCDCPEYQYKGNTKMASTNPKTGKFDLLLGSMEYPDGCCWKCLKPRKEPKPEVKLEKWTEKYLIVCPSCGGLGAINNPQPVTSTAQIICPACQGSKTVFVVKENLESQ